MVTIKMTSKTLIVIKKIKILKIKILIMTIIIEILKDSLRNLYPIIIKKIKTINHLTIETQMSNLNSILVLSSNN